MARFGPGCHALSTLFLACLMQVGAGKVAATEGAPTFELGSELLVTDVGAARLVGYGTVGERALELQVAAVSANVRVLVVAPDGMVAPFLGSFADGRLVLLLADGGYIDVADRLARDDRDLVFVLPDGRRVLVPVEGRERAPLDAAPRPLILGAPATTPSTPLPGDAGDGDSDSDSDGDWDGDSVGGSDGGSVGGSDGGSDGDSGGDSEDDGSDADDDGDHVDDRNDDVRTDATDTETGVAR